MVLWTLATTELDGATDEETGMEEEGWIEELDGTAEDIGEEEEVDGAADEETGADEETTIEELVDGVTEEETMAEEEVVDGVTEEETMSEEEVVDGVTEEETMAEVEVVSAAEEIGVDEVNEVEDVKAKEETCPGADGVGSGGLV